MKTVLVSLAAVFGLVATPALACAPMSPPKWSSVPAEGGPGIAIGRVVSVEPDGADRHFDYARLGIETLETVQGQVPDVLDIRVVSVRRIDPVEIILWCGRLSPEKVGDVVMTVQFSPTGYRLLNRSDVPAAYLARMDTFHADAD